MNGRSTLEQAYLAALHRHGHEPDRAQLHAVARLEDLRLRLEAEAATGASWLGRLAGRWSPAPPATIRGVYLWGGVGRGKTFLMDLFHSQLLLPSRRDHFHRFMRFVHGRLRQLCDIENPLEQVAAEIRDSARVLCLDELYVSDIADAMLLSGLFSGLVDRGMTLVVTSNSPPSDLYRDGLQRSRFLPAIALLERCTEPVNVDGGCDYRLRQLERAPLYLAPADDATEHKLAARFESIAGERGESGGELEIEGRAIPTRRRGHGIVWFQFEAICGGPRATADYVEIARGFHTVIVSSVPPFDASMDDAARRFIALVDEFYDRGVKLVLSAATPPDRLYGGRRLAFEFERTRSRLAEMQTHAYLARPHRP